VGFVIAQRLQAAVTNNPTDAANDKGQVAPMFEKVGSFPTSWRNSLFGAMALS
jgi:hypothetical protein